MANRFTGTLLGDDGKKLDGVNVVLKSGTVSQTTKTDKEGFFNITTPDNIDPKNTTITFSKNSYTLYKITNPQPTGAYIPSTPKIDPIYGGILDLKNSFDLGKYLISSLKPQEQEILYWELFNINEFLKENPGNYSIVIVASESTITNYDREEFLEDGVTPNPNWAGPPGTIKTKSLPSKALSDKRYASLKKYIEDFFINNGTPVPTLESDIKVGSNSPSDQYIRLEVRLAQVNCKTKSVNFGDKNQGDLILIKPPGATKITLDAFQFPDRFGINGKYNDYYTQTVDTLGSTISWEFIVYLSVYGMSLLNDNTIIKKEYTLDVLKSSLLQDLKTETGIKIQLVEFIKKSGKVGSSDPNLINRDDKLIVDLAIQNSIGSRAPVAYGLPIKRENTVIPLDNVGTNESFVLNQRKGVITGESIYSFNICNNQTTQ